MTNNKKQLQEQVYRLTNEIEELRLEREESKKNVLHFMQESDTLRQELKRAQEIIEELSDEKEEQGYNSPPPDSDNDEDEAHHHSKKKAITLFSKLSLLDETKISTLFQLLEDENSIDQLKTSLDQAKKELSETQLDMILLRDELDQTKEEYQATKSALQVESERADIMETRWKESENNLEQAEYTLQQRKEWTPTKNTTNEDIKQLLQQLQKDLDSAVNKYEQCKLDLENTENQHQQTQNDLISKILKLENKLKEDSTQAKIRETHLKTVNKTLREEIRKKNKVEEEIINVEYLRNVIIKFLERKNTRPQLVPILSMLLKCSKDEQVRLNQLTNRKIVS